MKIIIVSTLCLATSASPLALSPSEATSSLVINNAVTTPANASPPIDPDFPGFAFETAAFVRYAQYDDGSPNTFSQNLINSITSRTGGTPIIRLGGTSGDYAFFEPQQTTPALPVDEVSTYQDVGGTTIGPGYFPLSHNFASAKYIVQVPLAIDNKSATLQWTRAAVQGVGLNRIQAIEIGNEPNAYAGKPFGQTSLSQQAYEALYVKYERAIRSALGLGNKRIFQALDSGSGNYANYPVPEEFTLGINQDQVIAQVAEHYYQTSVSSSSNLQNDLMNHAAIVSQLNVFQPAIQYLQKNAPSVSFVISEVANSLDPTHKYAFQAVLGSALWQVDWQLYALTIGVTRVNFQQIMHSGFDLWLPVDSAGRNAQVYANFYAQPFIADFIGKTSDTRRVAQISTGFPQVPAYGAYVGSGASGRLERIAAVNLNLWNSSDGTPRPKTTLKLNVPAGVSSVRVEQLTSTVGGSASAANITYAGQQWTKQSNGLAVQVTQDSQTVQVKNGVANVDVLASQAVLVYVSS